jgi:acetyl-CoA carboxylase biotin carboxyl carrier protein
METAVGSIDIKAEISGSVWKVLVHAGEQVKAGDTLLIIESMKMEIPVEAPQDGTVEHVHVKETDTVDEEQVLASIKP